MTVPVLNEDELLAHIKAHGWAVASSDYWNDYSRLVLVKNDALFTFQCKGKYFYLEVVKICELLKIDFPEDHIRQYYLHHKMDDIKCYCKSELLFKDCHKNDD